MAWKKTLYKGVRYREHLTRMHGRQKDRYFNVRFRVAGIDVDESYGWASEGWSAKKTFLLMSELKEELRTGKGSGKLADRRKADHARREAAEAKEVAEARRNVTYNEYFCTVYWPDVSQDKEKAALKAEFSLHKNWILKTIGTTPIRDIGELHIKKLSRTMTKAGKAPRSIEYAFACVRMVIGHAIRAGYHPGPNPVTTLPRKSKPKYDNKRVRFFSKDEAQTLLDSLKGKSTDVHNITLLSIYCGLRAGEVFSLTWGDVDQVHGLVTLRDTKSGKTRTVHMPKAVKEMFSSVEPGKKSTLVFPARNGKKRSQMSKTFERTIEQLGLNDGIQDRRQKLTFHSCRHTCASWLVQAGIPLFTVQKIMGHSTIALTERYSHLCPEQFKKAAAALDDATDRSSKVMAIG